MAMHSLIQLLHSYCFFLAVLSPIVSISKHCASDKFVMLAGALSAEIEGDFVVFLIGAGVNNWWNLLSGNIAMTGNSMQKMLEELKVSQPYPSFVAVGACSHYLHLANPFASCKPDKLLPEAAFDDDSTNMCTGNL